MHIYIYMYICACMYIFYITHVFHIVNDTCISHEAGVGVRGRLHLQGLRHGRGAHLRAAGDGALRRSAQGSVLAAGTSYGVDMKKMYKV